RRNLGQRAPMFADVAVGELAADRLDDAAECLVRAGEMAVDRPPIDAQMLCHTVDRARAGRKQDDHLLAYPRCGGGYAAGGGGFEQLPRHPRDAGIGIWIRHIEVAPRADDPVEIVAKLDIATEHALMHAAIVRRLVRETHAPRAPRGAEQRPQYAGGGGDGG